MSGVWFSGQADVIPSASNFAEFSRFTATLRHKPDALDISSTAPATCNQKPRTRQETPKESPLCSPESHDGVFRAAIEADRGRADSLTVPL